MEGETFVKFLEHYSISNFGRVRNDRNNHIRIPQGRYKKYAKYKSVHIVDKNYSIHRLVATYFVKNPDQINFTIVNHIDGNPENNHYTNLEWCDHKHNHQHSIKMNTHTSLHNEGYKKQKQAKDTPTKTLRAKKDGMPYGVFKRHRKLTNDYAYDVIVGNTTTKRMCLGRYFDLEQASQIAKTWYFNHYGVYPAIKKQ